MTAEKSKRLNVAVQSVTMQRPFRGGGIPSRFGRSGVVIPKAAAFFFFLLLLLSLQRLGTATQSLPITQSTPSSATALLNEIRSPECSRWWGGGGCNSRPASTRLLTGVESKLDSLDQILISSILQQHQNYRQAQQHQHHRHQ